MPVNSLDSALSGLAIAQQQMATISGNVSNVNTTGYTRKILPQSTEVVDGQTIGVLSDSVTRDVDMNLESDFWTQQSQVSYLSTQATYLSKIQTFNGSSNSNSSIAAQISSLQNAFSTLSDTPDDSSAQAAVVTAATNVATTFNNFSSTLTNLRNQSQTDISSAVADVNSQLKTIASLNSQISFNTAGGQSTAALDDQRDVAVSALSKDMNISYFIRNDGVMVVQTTNGVALADTAAQTVTFKPTQLQANSGSGAAIYVGDPTTQPTAINISSNGGAQLGGTLGGLVDLRDNILPTQQASIDQMASQLANRMNDQGLALFTDKNGQIPSDAAANTSTNPPTPVAYSGFANDIQVNQLVQDNNALVQQGTAPTDDPVLSGSNEVITRITDYGFGANSAQVASGTVNLNTGAGTDLQHLLGLYSSNQVTGASDLSDDSSVTSLMAGDPNSFGLTGTLDSFELTFGESRAAPPLGPTTVTVSLNQAATDFPIGGAIKNAADQVSAEINKQIAAAPVAAGLQAAASVNSYGQLVLKSTGNITIDGSGANGMGSGGLTDLGLTAGTTVTTDPYITVQVGNGAPTQVSIEPGDTAADLVAKLDKSGPTDTDGIDGLGVQLNPATGFLTLRPGDSVTNPTFGGALTITGGPFTADGSGTITGGMPAGTDIIKALFGSDSPVKNVANDAIQTGNLGPDANLTPNVTSDGSIIDYAQQVVASQAQQYNDITTQQTSESDYANTLQSNLQNQSGVNIDTELSNMIVVQTAYSAAARLVTTIQSEFTSLLQAFE